MDGSSGWTASLSVQEANAVRAKLGLKPLREGTKKQEAQQPSRTEPAKPTRQQKTTDDEATNRNKALKAQRTLAAPDEEVDDVRAFVSASRKAAPKPWELKAQKQRALLDEQDDDVAQYAKLARQAEQEAGNLNVAHADVAARIAEGEDVILTLADDTIIDAETGDVRDADKDVLENAQWAAERRIEKAKALARKQGHAGGDDDHDHQLAVDPTISIDARMRNARTLQQYDDVVDGEAVVRADATVKLGSVAGAAAQQPSSNHDVPMADDAPTATAAPSAVLTTAKTTMSDATRQRLSRLANKTHESLAPALTAAAPPSDYLTQAEVAAGAKPKRRKKKKHLRRGDATDDAAMTQPPPTAANAAETYDALEKAAAAVDDDSGRRKRRRGVEAAVAAAAVAAAEASEAAATRARYESALERAEERGAHLKHARRAAAEGDQQDDSENALASMLERARRAALHCGGPSAAAPGERGVEALAARVRAEAVKEETERASTQNLNGSIVLDEMDEFARALPLVTDDAPALPSLQRATAAAALKEEREAAAEAQENAQAPAPMDGDGAAEQTGHAPPASSPKHESGAADDVAASAPRCAPMGGISAMLSAARDSGFLKEKVMWSGRNNELKRSELKDLEEQWEDAEARSRQHILMDRARNGGKASGSAIDALNHPDRFANVRVEYKDEYGFTMNPKDAFRTFCHQFHGQKVSKNTLEKRRKRYEAELARRASGNDNPMGDETEIHGHAPVQTTTTDTGPAGWSAVTAPAATPPPQEEATKTTFTMQLGQRK